jgi:hydroxymethylbilane synthase
MIVLGTRGSLLALAQARIVASALGADVELRVISTAGDRSERPIRELGDGVFVTALEDALRAGEIDIAVHSLKDLPTLDPPDLAIAAIPAREDPRDVVITRGRGGWRGLRAGDRVGTSSPRRDAFVRALAPGIVCAEIRGNIDTRLRKVREGEYDATVLAAAGLRRLGIAFAEEEALPIERCLPAPGQGALAVQMRADHALFEWVDARLNDPATRAAVETEREVLRLAGATCALPLGTHARSDGGEIVIAAAIASDAGIRRARARGSAPCDVAREIAEALGVMAHA